MTVDVFLKLADIKGDSNDAKHKDEIRVLSWDWGMEHSEASPGGSAGVGKTQFRRIRFAHLIDVASPLIMVACASGRRIREANLTMRRAGAAFFEFLTIKLPTTWWFRPSRRPSMRKRAICSNPSRSILRKSIFNTSRKLPKGTPDAGTCGAIRSGMCEQYAPFQPPRAKNSSVVRWRTAAPRRLGHTHCRDAPIVSR